MRTTDDKRGVRVPPEKWHGYARIVGNAGRSEDLRRYIEWRIDNPFCVLAGDPGAEHGPVRKLRVSEALWKPYSGVIPRGDCSADLRAYISWRIQHPDTPLPGRTRVAFDRYRERRGRA